VIKFFISDYPAYVLALSAVPVVLGVIFAYLIADCFVTVFEMTVDTIFISFCEDYEENNGMDRPYYMSRELMEIMYEILPVEKPTSKAHDLHMNRA
jgi:Plasma-membrane choline transporter